MMSQARVTGGVTWVSGLPTVSKLACWYELFSQVPKNPMLTQNTQSLSPFYAVTLVSTIPKGTGAYTCTEPLPRSDVLNA